MRTQHNGTNLELHFGGKNGKSLHVKKQKKKKKLGVFGSEEVTKAFS